MNWNIDTGSKGAAGCAPSDLKALLEGELAHYGKSQAEAAAANVMRATNAADLQDPAKLSAAMAAASAAKSKFLAKLPSIEAQAKAGIEAAVALASTLSGNVTATVCGHYNPNHPSGVAERLSVQVDLAAFVEE